VLAAAVVPDPVDEPHAASVANVEALLKQKGWSKAELARASGIDEGSLSKILRGEHKNLSFGTLQRFARALRVPAAQPLAGVPTTRLPAADAVGVRPGGDRPRLSTRELRRALRELEQQLTELERDEQESSRDQSTE